MRQSLNPGHRIEALNQAPDFQLRRGRRESQELFGQTAAEGAFDRWQRSKAPFGLAFRNARQNPRSGIRPSSGFPAMRRTYFHRGLAALLLTVARSASASRESGAQCPDLPSDCRGRGISGSTTYALSAGSRGGARN